MIMLSFTNERGQCFVKASKEFPMASTFLAASSGAMVAILVGAFMPLFVILVVLRNKKKKQAP